MKRFIAEESSNHTDIELSENPTWVIDPIDGTLNFYHNYPDSCISVALYVNRTNEIGIIYNPTLKQLFTARRGAGAFLNGNKISASNQTELRKSLVSIDPFLNVEYALALINRFKSGNIPCHG